MKTSNQSICIHCGQCIQVCPTNALCEVRESHKVKEAILNPKKTVVFMTSPSVRVALGEPFGKASGENVEGRMVSALRALGADYVFDTTFAADLTIMEEASELIERITSAGPLPQFTSCCPAWVKFTETYYPQYISNLSSSKSPISMFGPTVKSYFAKHANLDPEDIVSVALTPCTAKKFEIRRPELQDTDFVITTKELAEWMNMENIDLDALAESAYDSLMPRGSGAGIIFGNSGGVMEAAVRTAYAFLTNQEPPKDLLTFEPVRGLNGIKTCDVTIQDMEFHLAVISGTDNARRFIKEMLPKKQYHFVEVMTCPGGCISGGGQPQHLNEDMDKIRNARMDGLYQMDEKISLRLSHENPQIKELYEQFYGKPLSVLAKQYLHTHYKDRSNTLNEDPTKYADEYQKQQATSQTKKISLEQWTCSIRGYIFEGDITKEGDDYVCPICTVPKDLFEKI